jgi:hypothetical protein
MTGFLDWKYIDENTTASLEECCSEADVKKCAALLVKSHSIFPFMWVTVAYRVLEEVFRTSDVPVHKQPILADFHYQSYAYEFSLLFCFRASHSFLPINVYNTRFCKSAAFNARQISTLMSIMNDIILFDASSNSLKNGPEESFKRFQILVLKHSIERPPKR